jgi:hypothetical protein
MRSLPRMDKVLIPSSLIALLQYHQYQATTDLKGTCFATIHPLTTVQAID